jgi:AAA domain
MSGPDLNDTLKAEGPDAVRARLANAKPYNKRTNGRADPDDSFVVSWHGSADLSSSRPWLVYETIPEVGVGLLAGQWGTCKTFVALDLACAVMSGNTTIFGSDVDRRGGVLLYAAEGENEVAVRLQAAIENRCPEFKERAPFVWLMPGKMTLNLSDPDSVAKFIAHAQQIDVEMRRRFDIPLALILVDTVVATAGFKRSGDENDAVLGARLMKDGLGEIARQTRTFALGVDHFGKSAETGTRGSSGKEDNADVVLAILGEKSITGIVTNPRLAVRKTRGGVAGREYPFTTRIVDTGVLDAKQRPIKTLAITWGAEGAANAAKKDRWPKTLTLLHRVIINMADGMAKELCPFPDGPLVKAVDIKLVRAEFYKQYPAEGDTEKQRREATKKAFKRAIDSAQAQSLMGSERAMRFSTCGLRDIDNHHHQRRKG